MRRVLVSLHHTHGHSGVVIGDEGVLLVRDLRSSAAGWEQVQGERPGLLRWADGHAVAGGLLPGGAAAAALVTGGRAAAAVVARGAWIAAARIDDDRALSVRYTAADGSAAGEDAAGG